MESKNFFENKNNYKYAESVFVSGDLIKYVLDLEGYFRESARDLKDAHNYWERNLNSFDRRVNMYIEYGYQFEFYPNQEKFGIPFVVNKDNCKDARAFLIDKINFCKNLYKAQRVNHGKLLEVLLDGKNISELDLTNYAHKNHIVRIKCLNTNGKKIIMRIFTDLDNTNKGKGFAFRANHLDGVRAGIVEELDIKEPISSLEELANEKVRRSKLKIKPPHFEIHNRLIYNIFLTKEEQEMLNLFCISYDKEGSVYISSKREKLLIYGSPNWSSEQGKKILRNLFGIVGFHIEYRNHYWHSDFYISSQNVRAVLDSKNNRGIFIKKIEEENLPVLESVFNRTMELRKKYGNKFYPKFSITEISKINKTDKESTFEKLQNLVGILAKVSYPWTFENSNGSFYHTNLINYFLPKSRMRLAEEILHP